MTRDDFIAEMRLHGASEEQAESLADFVDEAGLFSQPVDVPAGVDLDAFTRDLLEKAGIIPRTDR